MKILIITQTVNNQDSNLGFFHDWLKNMSAYADLDVISFNKAGAYDLPKNVRVFSLRENKKSFLLVRLFRYQKFLYKLLPKANGIFFHMCPEYVLAAGFWPFIYRKKTLLWYTHKNTNWKLYWAEKFVDKVFTASTESFRLASRKVEIVGHGVDTNIFKPEDPKRVSGLKLLTVGRISPVKDLKTLILAVSELKNSLKNVIIFDIVGEVLLDTDRTYAAEIKELVTKLGLENLINFKGSIAHQNLHSVYNSHDVFLHASNTGSVDKAVLEALASGLFVFTSSEAYDKFGNAVYKFRKEDYQELAEKLREFSYKNQLSRNDLGIRLVREKFNLDYLLKKIITYFG